MLIAIVADTHLPRGARRLPDACVDLVRSAALVLHAGDFTDVSTLGYFEALGPPLRAVYGNVDAPDVRSRLPETELVEAAGVRIGMVHDAGPSKGRLARLQRTFPGADAVVFGHSHLPVHEEQHVFQIFNPGSPTERRRAVRHTMGLARVERGRLSFEHLGLA